MDEQVKKGLQGKIAMKRAEMNLESDEAALQQLIDNAKTGAGRAPRGSVEGRAEAKLRQEYQEYAAEVFPDKAFKF